MQKRIRDMEYKEIDRLINSDKYKSLKLYRDSFDLNIAKNIVYTLLHVIKNLH